MSIYSIFLVTNPVVQFKGSLKPSLVSELFQFYSAKKDWYFSYFYTQTYIVGTEFRNALVRLFK